MPRLRLLLVALALASPACLAAAAAASGTPAATGEPAVPAAAFVDSVGVNVPAGDAAAGWALAERLRAAGIRHARGPAAAGTDDPSLAGLQALAGADLQLDLVVGPDADPAGVVEAAAAVGAGVTALEVADGRSPAPLRQALRAQPGLPAVAVLGQAAGADYHTDRVDLGGRCPGCVEDLGAGDAAVQVTEVTVGAGVPGAVAARYLPRLLLAHAGLAVRTYLDGRGQPDAGPGLFDAAGSPTPAYHAVASLLTLLGDRGRQVEPDRLAYRLSGDTGAVRQRLLQKADGRFWLALWVEKPGWDPVAGRELAVPAQQVKLTLAAPMAGARAYLPELGVEPEHSFAGALKTLELEVSDQVLLLELLPDRAGTAPAPGPSPAPRPAAHPPGDEPVVRGGTALVATPTPAAATAWPPAPGVAAPATAAAPSSPLAFTGSAALSMLVASGLLMLVGLAALAASRRRYHPRH